MAEDIGMNNEEQAMELFQTAQTNTELRVFARKIIGENTLLKKRLESAQRLLHDYQETGPCTLHEAQKNMMYLKGANTRKLWAIVLLSAALACAVFSCHSNKKQLKTIQQQSTARQY